MLRPGAVDPDAAVWPGDDAPGAGFFAVRVEGVVVACGSVVPEPHPVSPREGDWRVRGMATDPEHRGHGYGTALAAACVDHARSAGASRVWLQARPAAIALYERAGFVRESDDFDVPGLGPHVLMGSDLAFAHPRE